MLKIDCDDCGKELNDTGGLLFAPPDAAGECLKLHLCRDCFDGIYRLMQQRRYREQQTAERAIAKEKERANNPFFKQIAADKKLPPPLTPIEKWLVDAVYDIQQYSGTPDGTWKNLVMEAIKRISEQQAPVGSAVDKAHPHQG